MGGQALCGEAEDPKDFMTVLVFGLGLEGCMPGKRSGDQEGKQQKQRPRDVQQWGLQSRARWWRRPRAFLAVFPAHLEPRSHSVFR